MGGSGATAMSRMAPALVLGYEPRVALTIARSLHRRGIAVDVCRIGKERDIRSRYVRNHLALSSAPEAAAQRLTALVREYGYSYIMPTSDTALAIILRCESELRSLTRLACPPADRVRQVLDKEATLALAKGIGVPVPVSRLEEITGPMIVKPVDKSLTHGYKVRYFTSVASYREATATETTLTDGVMVQAFAAGDGVGVEILMHDGESLAAFQHRRIRELPWSGGVGVVARSEPVDPQLYRHAFGLLQALQWEGIAMIEFRHDPISGETVLLEINGRYFGSLSLSYLAGVDFPYLDWQRAHGLPPDVVTGYRTGLRWRWSAGVLYRLKGIRLPGPPWLPRPSLLREFIGLLRDLLPPTRDALWDRKDPGPAIKEIIRAMSDLVSSLLKSTLRVMVPQRILRHLRYWRHLDPTVRRPLLRLRLRQLLGVARLTTRPLPEDIRSVLFICHGNIIRSAFSEAWIRQRLDADPQGICIQSAGLRAIEGKPADPRAVTAAGEMGVDLALHEAKPLTSELIESSDLIVVMDYLNEANLLARFPQARDQIRLVAECGGGTQADEVTDPYNGDIDTVRESYRRLQPLLEGFVTRLLDVRARG